MKFELVVLQNGAEGKRIALASALFKIGRGETCNLRPNSERVSREHAEFTIKNDTLHVRDLGSRNGTLVNGKPISESVLLTRGDQVTVGPLSFVVAIDGLSVPEVKKAASTTAEEKPKSGSPVDEIAALLLGGDEKKIASEPASVYSGETITITAFRAGDGQIPASSGITEAAKMDDQGFERQTEDEEDEESSEEQDEFIDESNPFYQKKTKEQPVAEGPKKEVFKDTADAASAILRKLMERKSDD
jgi:pSer/pThr/pTyr-binding forkhead associated (FHA) protein